MSATKQHEVIEALVAVFAGAVSFPVYDGPDLSADSAEIFLTVGYDPVDNDGRAATTQQEYVNIGSHSKSETGTIRCTLTAWSGDSSTTARRRLVAEALSDCEAALRADISLGGLVLWANFGPSVDLNQILTQQGNQVYARFDVAYTARV